MIKKILKNYQPYMIRPTVYLCATKVSIALVLALCWDRFINKHHYFSLISDAFLVCSFILFALAWFQYLRLDGVRIIHMNRQDREEIKKKKKKKIHWKGDIVDFADEKIIPLEDLEPEEQSACRFTSSVACGVLFLVPALLGCVFGW